MKIIGTGFTCLDYINYMGEKYFSSGGTCTNVLVALSSFGFDSCLLMPSYKDELFNIFVADVKSKGITNAYYSNSSKKFPRVLQIMKDSEHFFKTKCEFCQRSLINIETLSSDMALTLLNYIADSNFFYCDRISKGITLLCEEAKKINIWTMYEPNNCRFYKQQLDAMKQYDIIKFSTGRISESISEKIKSDLEESSIKLMVVTRGQEGIKYVVRSKCGKLTDWKYIKGNLLDEKIDSSGAGDWFSASLIYNLVNNYKRSNMFLNEEDINKYLLISQKVSEISCKSIGAQGILYEDAKLKEIINILEIDRIINPVNRLYTSSKLRCPYCNSEFFC